MTSEVNANSDQTQNEELESNSQANSEENANASNCVENSCEENAEAAKDEVSESVEVDTDSEDADDADADNEYCVNAEKDNATSQENAEKNEQFLRDRAKSTTEKRYVRHSLQARLTHAIVGISCILLCLTGLCVFVPPITRILPAGLVFAIRMSHRVIGLIFVLVPIISAIMSPKGVVHIFKELFAKWTSDDKKWMALFLPYLFMAKWLHMPDQDESKSGQRIADGAIWLSCFIMAISGVTLVLKNVIGYGGGVYSVALFFHDLGFLLICVFGLAHIFLGSGLFQPYRGLHRIMYGDGTVDESNLIYHWGHFARKELESGENIIEVPKE